MKYRPINCIIERFVVCAAPRARKRGLAGTSIGREVRSRVARLRCATRRAGASIARRFALARAPRAHRHVHANSQ